MWLSKDKYSSKWTPRSLKLFSSPSWCTLVMGTILSGLYSTPISLHSQKKKNSRYDVVFLFRIVYVFLRAVLILITYHDTFVQCSWDDQAIKIIASNKLVNLGIYENVLVCDKNTKRCHISDSCSVLCVNFSFSSSHGFRYIK